MYFCQFTAFLIFSVSWSSPFCIVFEVFLQDWLPLTFVCSKSIPACPLSAEIWCWSSLILKLCLLPPLKGNELVTSHLPSSPPDTKQRNLDKNYPIWGQRRKIQKQVVERTIPQRVLATASQAIISSQTQPHRQSTKSLFLVLSQAQTKISTTK